MKLNIPNKIIQIINILETKGEAYLVGGAVRDLILNISPKDYDVATSLEPKEVLRLFPQSKFVGKSFGVVLVDDVEIATYRRDHYEKMDGKNCKVEFVNTIEEDLARRDFTINAMAYHPERGLVDPFGGGKDIENKYLRFVGDGKERVEEDYCRLLRILRFVARLGLFFDTYPVRYVYSLIQLIAPERVRKELLEILSGEFLDMAMTSPVWGNMIRFIFPSLAYCDGIGQNKHHKDSVCIHSVLATEAVSPRYPLLRLAALLHDVGKPPAKVWKDGDWHFYNHEYYSVRLARKMLRDLTFSNEEINYVCEIIRWHMFFVDLDKTGNLKKYVRRLQSKLKYCTVRDIVRMRLADRKGNRAKLGIPFHLKQLIRDIRAVEKEDAAVKIKDLAINGNDIMKEFGLEQSPKIGILLKKCLEKVVDYPECNIKRVLLDYCVWELDRY